MGKIKAENNENDVSVKDEEVVELSYDEKLQFCSKIAKPMATRKLTKKTLKLIKKAMKHKTYLRCGLKDVQTRIRKGETGIVVFAGDITPIEIMCHLPGVCEEHSIPYVYVPSRKDLGGTLGVKRGCLMVLIRENEEYKESYDECYEEIKHLAVSL